MGKADLHAHTCHDGWCDGNQSIEEMFRHVEEETDLDLFGLTDHDNADTARAAWEIYRRGRYRFDFLPGVEVTNGAGHLLVYFPGGSIVDIPSLRPFWWTVDFAHRHGAIALPAHPVYPPWLVPTIRRGLARGRRLDGIEAINAGISAAAQERLSAGIAALDARLARVAGSDAHDRSAVGSAFTRYPGSGTADFLAALQGGTTTAVLVSRPVLPPHARSFTRRRSMTRPGWVRNLWREATTR
ncbi:MAG TPA: PHP-associated domain-containing protein [Chloroflexota bacterium]|nr:PHP-associated domain-containing protein [Chloroflexota bacterium]